MGMDYSGGDTPGGQLDGSCYWAPEGLFLMMCENIIAQAKRAGFRALVADGHGPSRRFWGQSADAWEARYGIKLVAVARDFPKRWRSQMDHAAQNETSLMMALHPQLVDLTQLPEDRSIYPRGVGGVDPRDSTAAHGEECIAACLELLGEKLRKLGMIGEAQQ